MNKTVIYISNVSPLQGKEHFEKYYNLMPKYRKEKVDGLASKKDKILSLGVGVLLKKACFEFGIAGQDEYIDLNQFGKPYFNGTSIGFSLSHSNEMAMCAISTKDVGCDIEYIKEIKKNVSKKVFTDKEIADFNTNEKDGFYSLWTLKESFLKKIGKGFSFNPKNIEIDKNLKVNIDDKTKLYLNEINGYKIACAYETDGIALKKIDL